MTAVLLTPLFETMLDNNGIPLAGGLIYTYSAGTTTPLATYTDATGTTPASNPIVLDSAGRPPNGGVWGSGVYKFILKTSAGVQVGNAVDNVTAIYGAGDMTKAVYDAANIAQQLVGTSAVQTLTNKTLTTPVVSGRTDGIAASAGNVGEILSTTLASGSAVALVTATAKTVTSVSLTAGVWAVSGIVQYTSAGTTTSTRLDAVISLTNNTSTTLGTTALTRYNSSNTGTNPGYGIPVGPVYLNLAATTTVYLVAVADFAVSTLSAYGQIQAIRIQA